MPQFDRKLAVQTASENRDLHERLDALREEEQHEKDQHRSLQSSPGRAEKVRKRNEELKDEILMLKSDLADLRRTNVTQLYHTYTRLNTRLAYLNNENMSLRAILSNQRQGVRKATRAFHDHQVRRKRNDMSNTHTRQDIQMIKERREECVAQTNMLRKEKARLERELEDIPPAGKDPVGTQKKLQQEYRANEREIDKLEREIKAAEENAKEDAKEPVESDQDLEDLREEYKELKHELKQIKKNRASRRA